MNNGKFVVPPTLSDVFSAHAEDIGSQLRVCIVGAIETYDPVKRTATVTMSENLVLNDGTVVKVNKPLVDVPVFTLQGGGIHVGLPITPGDECLVIFNDFNIDAWFKAGGQQTPPTSRQHDISDGFALVGPNSLAHPLVTNLLEGEGGLASADAKVALKTTIGVTKVTVQNGPLPANNLNGILQVLLAAIAASSVLDAPTKAAATTAAAELGTLLY